MEIQKKSLLLIGYGNMGSAMIAPLTETHNITVISPNTKPTINCQYHKDFADHSPSHPFDLIILACKPYHASTVLPRLPDAYYTEKTLLVSILAGADEENLRKLVKNPIRVAKTLPNLGVRVGKGITVVKGHFEELKFLEQLGKLVEVETDEEYERVATPSGCGTGYVYKLLEAFQKALVRTGVSETHDPKELTYTIFAGALANFEGSRSDSFEQLKNKVATPKGLTEAGLDQMGDFEDLFVKVIESSKLRDRKIKEETNK